MEKNNSLKIKKTLLECDNYHIKVEHDYKSSAHNPQWLIKNSNLPMCEKHPLFTVEKTIIYIFF